MINDHSIYVSLEDVLLIVEILVGMFGPLIDRLY